MPTIITGGPATGPTDLRAYCGGPSARSDHAEGNHGVGNLAESGDVRPQDVVAGAAELFGGLQAGGVDVFHDLGEALLGVLEAPGVTAGVLLHLQCAGSHATGVRGFAGPESDPGFTEHRHRPRSAGHVRPLGDGLHTVLDQRAGSAGVGLVVRGTGHGNRDRHIPHAAALDEPSTVAATLRVLVNAAALDLLDLPEQGDVDAVVVDDVARRVGSGHGDAAELLGLLDRIDRHVARTRDAHTTVLEGGSVGAQHLIGEDRGAVAGGLGTNHGAAPVEALAGLHPRLIPVGQALVLTEQVANLTGADADVTGRHIGVLTHVPMQLGHERLAESHHLTVGSAVRSEVGATLAAADRQTGQGVFEDLLETEELHDAEVDRGVETQPALVRAERGVVLNAKSPIDLDVAGIIDPGDAEDDLALRLAQPHQDRVGSVLGVLALKDLQGLEHLLDGLMEFRLPRVPVQDLVIGVLER